MDRRSEGDGPPMQVTVAYVESRLFMAEVGLKTLNGTLHLTFPATSSIVGATSHDWLRLQVVWSAGGLTKPVFHQTSGRRDRPSRGAGATELQWHRGQGTQKKDNRKKPLDPGVTECRSLIDG